MEEEEEGKTIWNHEIPMLHLNFSIDNLGLCYMVLWLCQSFVTGFCILFFSAVAYLNTSPATYSLQASNGYWELLLQYVW